MEYIPAVYSIYTHSFLMEHTAMFDWDQLEPWNAQHVDQS